MLSPPKPLGPPFRGYGYVPLRNGGNVVTRIGTQQQPLGHFDSDFIGIMLSWLPTKIDKIATLR